MQTQKCYNLKSHPDLEEIANMNKEYSRLYVNINEKNNMTVLSTSINEGQYLYALTNKENPQLHDFFDSPVEEKAKETFKEPVLKKQRVQKAKQSTLFNFIKK
ncbi:hypothetical protein TCON_1522 [Astathelohania contejeani]|uniref:Uncharacterized protein n=1 Tax=Astathelohania contejeani TaxID=164912 RepID=A0ABQ7HYT6_9MICR|nr:hypothetical protein TCON_1522 [Thelohania contejeani]